MKLKGFCIFSTFIYCLFYCLWTVFFIVFELWEKYFLRISSDSHFMPGKYRFLNCTQRLGVCPRWRGATAESGIKSHRQRERRPVSVLRDGTKFAIKPSRCNKSYIHMEGKTMVPDEIWQTCAKGDGVSRRRCGDVTTAGARNICIYKYSDFFPSRIICFK